MIFLLVASSFGNNTTPKKFLMFVLLAAIFRPWNEKLALLKDRQMANATFSTSASDCPSVRPILAIFSLFFQYSRTQAVCAQGHFCPFCTIFTLQPAKAFTLLPCLTHSLTPSLPHSLILSLPHSSHSSHSLILALAELFYLQHARSRGVDFAGEHGEMLSERE